MFRQVIYETVFNRGAKLIDLFREKDCQLTIRKTRIDSILVVNPKSGQRHYTLDELKEIVRIMETD
jgi:hypothetical protein